MSESTISYAVARWADKGSVQSWTPLYEPMETDGGKKFYFDAFGRQAGEPYYGKVRTPCKEEASGDVRYYCFSTSEEKVVIYRETGYSSVPRWPV